MHCKYYKIINYFLFFLFLLLNFEGCIYNNFRNAANYFEKNKNDLNYFRDQFSNKKTISLFSRREFDNCFYRIFGQQEIYYWIYDIKNDAEIEFNLNKYFDTESEGLKKLLESDSVKCTQNNEKVELDSLLTFFDISRIEVINYFSRFKELDIVRFGRLNAYPNSIYFYINNKFYFIYSENIKNINLDSKKTLKNLEGNWYYYDGEI